LHAGIAPETLSFVFGSDGSLLSDLCGRLVCWCAFYALIHIFYHIFAPGVRAFCERWYPDAPTSAVPQKLVDNMIEVSHAAFPLYVTVPLLTDFFQVKGWSQACGGIDDCGGPARALLGCAAYFLLLEFIIFVDHYYLLHKWSVGKRLGQHAFHHVYKYADQLNAYSGYSFAPQDGAPRPEGGARLAGAGASADAPPRPLLQAGRRGWLCRSRRCWCLCRSGSCT